VLNAANMCVKKILVCKENEFDLTVPVDE